LRFTNVFFHREAQSGENIMFNGLLAKLRADDNPRLHRTPFMLIWIAAYGFGWITSVIVWAFLDDFLNGVIIPDNESWLIRFLLYASFGLILAIAQSWLVRRRYGFAPRFWRTSIVLASIIGGHLYFLYGESIGWTSIWGSIAILLVIFSVCQTIVLLHVSRQALYFLLIAFLAIVVAGMTETFIPGTEYQYPPIWAMTFATLIQGLGSSLVMLRMMANPRESIIPKREPHTKAKEHSRSGLHPVTFIGLWTLVTLSGWGFVIVGNVFWHIVFGATETAWDIHYWISDNAIWIFGIMTGLCLGVISTIGHHWLIQQYNSIKLRHWILFNMLGYVIAGIAIVISLFGSQVSDAEIYNWLIVWSIAPILLQTIPMWRTIRGGWSWILIAVVSVTIVYLIYEQSEQMYNVVVYVIVFNGIVQSILSGVAYILLSAQQPIGERSVSEMV
ncbi:MAG: hypothetical protein AAFV93_20480, partial [Chloroflexota bacterium]